MTETNLVVDGQNAVRVLCEFSQSQDAVVGRDDDIIIHRWKDTGNDTRNLRELLLQQTQHSGPQAGACT